MSRRYSRWIPIHTTERRRYPSSTASTGERFEWAMHGKHTSTSYHLGRIAKALGLRPGCAGLPGQRHRALRQRTPNRCISECLANTSCKAFTNAAQVVVAGPGTCFWKSGTGSGATPPLR